MSTDLWNHREFEQHTAPVRLCSWGSKLVQPLGRVCRFRLGSIMSEGKIQSGLRKTEVYFSLTSNRSSKGEVQGC